MYIIYILVGSRPIFAAGESASGVLWDINSLINQATAKSRYFTAQVNRTEKV
jgi:hypothetical protein